jgi:hypothetical protein
MPIIVSILQLLYNNCEYSNSGATVTAISSNATCGASNGSITATGLGGTTPYQYSLDGITYQASNIFTGLAAGAYTVTIKDAIIVLIQQRL